ncbi:MAG: type IV pilus assembly protein PilM [Planctomycetaceae bacterium]
MADSSSAWGIEIGQAGLKAIRLRATGSDKVAATAFDFIPHAKILSQPDAIPEELIRQSMTTFLERNSVDGDLIAISVPGQSSLAKFIKLPPVEPSKVAEIVKYEARQQIPFDLNEVIWDYQPIGGGEEESGFMLEAEVGLFAMKRDLVYEAMRPFMSNGKEVEIIQLAPLAVYNYLSYDVLGFRKTADTPEPPSTDEYYVMLDMGADNTTLLVSNGRSIWIRNVPIGGNHFTRSLTREMKLTFAKAEHLKINATKSPDPKSVFQAMRPVFNDYVSEIQKSIGFFGSVNRGAKIKKVIGVGNGFRLAGLQKFLQQNLQYDVERLEHLSGATGDSVLADPLFVDNIMTFAVPYGLALQAVGQTRIRTSLLPPEIAVERKIRSKKPVAVAAAAGLMLAMGIGTMASAHVLGTYGEEKWKPAQDAVTALQSAVSANQNAYSAEKTRHEERITSINQLVAPLEKRVLWAELLKAVNECLPRDEGNALDQSDISLQRRIHLDTITSKKVEDVGAWYQALKDGRVIDSDDGDAADGAEASASELPAPEGAGYIVTLRGYHFYNNESLKFEEKGEYFVLSTLNDNLSKWTIDRGGWEVPVAKLGISHPIVVSSIDNKFIYDPNARFGENGAMTGGPGMGGGYPGMGGGYPGGSGDMYGETGGETPGALGGFGGSDLGGPGLGGPAMGGLGLGGPGLGGPGMGGPGMGSNMYGGQGAAGGGNVVFEEKSKEDLQQLERTDFILQFVWKPTVERDRVDSDPAVSGETASEEGGVESPADPSGDESAATSAG